MSFNITKFQKVASVPGFDARADDEIPKLAALAIHKRFREDLRSETDLSWELQYIRILCSIVAVGFTA